MALLIDSHSGLWPHRPQKNRELLLQQFKVIGETLMRCESVCHRVGIPWLPPTQAVRKRAAQFEPPLKDFLRYSLVTVSTKTLEMYCYDLESAEPITPDHHITAVHPIERYSLATIVFGTLFAANLLFSNWLSVPLQIGVVSSLFVGFFGASLCVIASSERSRRRSFHWALTQELLRRRGQSDGGLPIISVETEPAPD